AFNDGRVTFRGEAPAEVARDLASLPVQVIGANCGVGSSVLYDVGLALHATAPEAWVSIRPNAGLPSRHGERLIYLSSPAYMADYASRMLDAGMRIVGGCCGTTPAHIRVMREVVDRHAAGHVRSRRTIVMTPSPAPEWDETPSLGVQTEPSRLLSRLHAKEFLVTVELDPPRGHNIEKLVQGAKLLAERGVEVVDINDGSLGR